MDITYDDNNTTINIDKTPCQLEMGFNTTLDFKGKKCIDIITMGREHYRTSIILSVISNGF